VGSVPALFLTLSVYSNWRVIMSNLTVKKMTKFAMATTAAALFASATVPGAFAADPKESTSVKCMGINACKGQSKCKTAANACSGQNSCKGHGWLPSSSAEECTAKGGTVIK
jgi:hypothetical protein